MSRHKLFLEHPIPSAGNTLVLDGDQAWHAVAVKRVQDGEKVELLDGRGWIGTALVVSTEKRGRAARLSLIIETCEVVPPTSPSVHVWSAVPKADRAAWMVEQLAQAGAASWCPLTTERGVTEAAEHKLDRLERVSAESAKQCGRAWLMGIGPTHQLDDLRSWLAEHAGGVVFIADGKGSSASGIGAPLHALVLVGPEGGFTESEVRRAVDLGAVRLRLGPHVLRTESASFAAVVSILAR